jgi:flagellar biosynthesis/type III secretory pathway chaperone
MNPTPLETALLDVHSTLSELLVAADDQYAAVAERDRDRLEGVTRRQEQLAARLERAERQRVAVLDGSPMRAAIRVLPQEQARRVAALHVAIARNVRQLQQRNARASNLLAKSIALTSANLQFLHRLAAPTQPTYGTKGGVQATGRSVLVDSRA